MNMCTILGHRLPTYCGEPVYGQVRAVDGIGRHHADVYADCDRCGTRYLVVKIHLPPPVDEAAIQLRNRNKELERELVETEKTVAALHTLLQKSMGHKDELKIEAALESGR